MNKLNFDLDHLDVGLSKVNCSSKSKQTNSRSIAIIGIDAKVGEACTTDEIWEVFLNGWNMISELPSIRRKDVQTILKDAGIERHEFKQIAYFPRIDLFDSGLFNISPMEAEYIDPAQRIYLESAWSAIEDAGYGGNKLFGSKTGVYVGYSSKSSMEETESDIPDEALGLAVSGKVNSFMASRLNYLLNLKGPAMIVDTACSSSLVALHEACRALRNKDISMAVVGSINVCVCPGDGKKQMGTSSSSGYTKSFDEKADGTGGGEGVINLILKPLVDAEMDNDHIYGIIKGSCINQDGKSIGLTAPNSEAQAELIAAAWKDAGVVPENISYIEAHGTATKLGDPVEIGGLTEAFSKLTSKKQFCALGAAKSNFGHLDSAAGLLGVLKVLLMMQHHVIPPTIHFNTPNRKIDFINSPIYINDKVKEWKSEDGILTAGVNSFGLSGTNCHVILQSYNQNKNKLREHNGKYLLTASAKEKENLIKILRNYQKFLEKNTEIDFLDFCYTVNTGRGQYDQRFVGVFSSVDEFLSLDENSFFSEKYYSNLFEKKNILSEATSSNVVGSQIQSEELEGLNNLDHESKLAFLYLSGSNIDFESLYEDEQVYRISAPVYEFNHKRCELVRKRNKNNEKQNVQIIKNKINPLVDKCVIETDNIWVFEKEVSLDSCLEIREHRINGVNVLPGTAYVEMAHAIAKYILGSDFFTFVEITFFNLMVCRHNEKRIMHGIVEKKDDNYSLRVVSRNSEDSEWILHSKMTIKRGYELSTNRKIHIPTLLNSYDKHFVVKKNSEEKDSFVQLGEHWDCAGDVYIKDDSLVLCTQVREDLIDDIKDYHIFPALLDGSVNAGNVLLGENYLPLNYKDAVIYDEIKSKVYSKIVRLNPGENNKEVELFKIEIYNEHGYLIGEVQQYALKRCHESDLIIDKMMSKDIHEVCWKSDILKKVSSYSNNNQDKVYVVLRNNQNEDKICSEIEKRYHNVSYIYVGNNSRQISDNSYEIGNTENEISILLQQLNISDTTIFINLLCKYGKEFLVSEEAFEGLKASFNLVKAFTKFTAQISLVSILANAEIISGKEKSTNPLGCAGLGFMSCIGLEQSTIDTLVIDTDEETDAELLIDEIHNPERKTVVGFRRNIRYLENICKRYKATNPVNIMNGDVIVIPGGYGGIGLSISEYLLQNYNDIRIVLLSRTGADNKLSDNRFRRFEKLLSQGYKISVKKADVTNRKEIAETISQVRTEYGHIDGVIFAAGIGEKGILVNKSWNDEWEVMKSKTLGVWNMDLETANDNLKYFIMFSSVTSLFGSAGQSAYAAANAFLDNYVLKSQHENCSVMTINWTGWKESGMAYNWGVDMSKGNLHYVSDEEGKEIFGLALKAGLRRTAVLHFRDKLTKSEYNRLQKRIILPEEYVMSNDASENVIENIEIYGKSPDKLTEEEKNIALAWSRTLKINSVNIYSKFFEVGGNSLLASYLHEEISKIYPSKVAITDVFAYSTIASMAEYIAEKNKKTNGVSADSEDDADIEALVQQFVQGNLQIDEIEHLI